jgi:hypothetical protein
MASNLAIVPHPYLENWTGQLNQGHGTPVSANRQPLQWSAQRGSPSQSTLWNIRENRSSFTEDDSEEEVASSSQSSPETEADSPVDAPTYNYRQCQPFTYTPTPLRSLQGLYLESQSPLATQPKDIPRLKLQRSSTDSSATPIGAGTPTNQMKFVFSVLFPIESSLANLLSVFQIFG